MTCYGRQRVRGGRGDDDTSWPMWLRRGRSSGRGGTLGHMASASHQSRASVTAVGMSAHHQGISVGANTQARIVMRMDATIRFPRVLSQRR